MHVSIIMLEVIENPLTNEQISNLKVDENTLWDFQNCNPNFFDYFYEENSDTSFLVDPSDLSKIYNNSIFELVQEDKNYGINYIYKIKKDAAVYLGKTKIDSLKKELERITPENFKDKYRNLLSSVVDEFDMYIIEDYTFYPLDEWLLDIAKENKQYQVIQIFDAHI